MDYKKGKDGKKANKKAADKANAAMVPMAEADLEDWETCSNEQVVQMMQRESISKAIISMINALKNTATPMEKAFAREVMNAQGILISFEPMKPKQVKKTGFFNKLFHKKPKVTEVKQKYTRSMIEKKLSLYFKSQLTWDAVVHDRTLFAFVMQEYDKFPEIKDVFDNIYTQINDPKVLLLMIRKRFGVILLHRDGSSEEDLKQALKDVIAGKDADYADEVKMRVHGVTAWNAEALKTMYRIFTHTPQGHLDMLDCLIHTDGGSHNEWGTGVNYISYEEGEEHRKFSPNEKDQEGMRGSVEALPYNATHELGHVVDNKLGILSGEGKEMRKVSSWVEVENQKEQILKFVEESIDGELYDGLLDEYELQLAHDFAKDFLGKTRIHDPNSWDRIIGEKETGFLQGRAYKLFRKLPSEKREETVQKVVEKVIAVMTNKDIKTNVLYHCWFGHAKNEAMYHFNEEMRGMKRPFHQGYKGRSWYSFDQSRWSDKISDYQYREPAEEFAETYASYHAAPSLGKKKGEMTPKPLLEWFLKTGLDKADPQKHKGGSAPQKDDDKK
ncbi:MAG: hypothetical protein IJU23_03345 [Proteobacteria bacterium]|nr:hypothetical protein [Pseudomonadota bacterium]